jgi:hypothetical protein
MKEIHSIVSENKKSSSRQAGLGTAFGRNSQDYHDDDDYVWDCERTQSVYHTTLLSYREREEKELF